MASFDFDRKIAAVKRTCWCEWQILDLGVQVFFVLVTFGVEVLFEVTLIIEQANTNEWYTQIAGALDVITRQDP